MTDDLGETISALFELLHERDGELAPYYQIERELRFQIEATHQQVADPGHFPRSRWHRGYGLRARFGEAVLLRQPLWWQLEQLEDDDDFRDLKRQRRDVAADLDLAKRRQQKAREYQHAKVDDRQMQLWKHDHE